MTDIVEGNVYCLSMVSNIACHRVVCFLCCVLMVTSNLILKELCKDILFSAFSAKKKIISKSAENSNDRLLRRTLVIMKKKG